MFLPLLQCKETVHRSGSTYANAHTVHMTAQCSASIGAAPAWRRVLAFSFSSPRESSLSGVSEPEPRRHGAVQRGKALLPRRGAVVAALTSWLTAEKADLTGATEKHRTTGRNRI